MGTEGDGEAANELKMAGGDVSARKPEFYHDVVEPMMMVVLIIITCLVATAALLGKGSPEGDGDY